MKVLVATGSSRKTRLGIVAVFRSLSINSPAPQSLICTPISDDFTGLLAVSVIFPHQKLILAGVSISDRSSSSKYNTGVRPCRLHVPLRNQVVVPFLFLLFSLFL